MILEYVLTHLMPVSACMQKSREKLKYEDEEIEDQYCPSIIYISRRVQRSFRPKQLTEVARNTEPSTSCAGNASSTPPYMHTTYSGAIISAITAHACYTCGSNGKLQARKVPFISASVSIPTATERSRKKRHMLCR